MNWSQPICDSCWTERKPGRVPVRLRAANCETCAYCGHPTRSGIYVRANPTHLPYPKPDGQA